MPKSFSYILHDLPTRYYDTSAPFFQFALPAHSTIHSMYYSVFLKCDYIIIIAKIINEKEKWNFQLFFSSHYTSIRIHPYRKNDVIEKK